jgi:hypothetical protein
VGKGLSGTAITRSANAESMTDVIGCSLCDCEEVGWEMRGGEWGDGEMGRSGRSGDREIGRRGDEGMGEGRGERGMVMNEEMRKCVL